MQEAVGLFSRALLHISTRIAEHDRPGEEVVVRPLIGQLAHLLWLKRPWRSV